MKHIFRSLPCPRRVCLAEFSCVRASFLFIASEYVRLSVRGALGRCDPSSSAAGLELHTQGTGAAGGKARVGGSLDSTPRGV